MDTIGGISVQTESEILWKVDEMRLFKVILTTVS